MSKTQTEIAGYGQPLEVRAPGDTAWRAFDPASPPEAGTQVRIRGNDGRQVITTYNGPDDFTDPVPTTATPSSTKKAPTGVPDSTNWLPNGLDSVKDPSVKAAAKLVDKYAANVNDPEASQAQVEGASTRYDQAVGRLEAAMKVSSAADTKSGGADANTQALAQAGQQMIAAGRTPSQAELEAMAKVGASGGRGAAQASGALAWLQQQMRAGNGTQGFGTASQWNGSEQGQDINTPLGTRVPLVSGVVTAVTPWGEGDYAINVRQANGTEVMIGHIARPSYKVGQQVSEADAVESRGAYQNGDPLSNSSGPQVEIRVKQNGQYVDPAQYVESLGTGGLSGFALPPVVQPSHVVGPGSTLVGPDGKPLYTAGPAATTDLQVAQAAEARANTDKIRQELTGKTQTLLQQQHDTIGYIQSQLASGAITPGDANRYFASVKDYTNAAMAGTTPFAIYEQQLQQTTQRAQIGRDILDEELRQGTTMADSLLKATGPDATSKLLVAPSTPFDFNSVLGASKANVEQYIPPELSNVAQGLVGALSGGVGQAPGQTAGTPGSQEWMDNLLGNAKDALAAQPEPPTTDQEQEPAANAA